jgi:hypothetical protein
MSYAKNKIDGTRVYFEDDGGDRAAVVVGETAFADSVDVLVVKFVTIGTNMAYTFRY